MKKIKNRQQFEDAINALLKNIGAQKEGKLTVDYINTSTGRDYSIYQPIKDKRHKDQDFVEARKHGLILQYMAVRADIEEKDLPSFGYCLVAGELQPMVNSSELIERINLDWEHSPNATLESMTINPKDNMITAVVNIGSHSKMYYLLYVADGEKCVYCSNNLEHVTQKVKHITQKENK